MGNFPVIPPYTDISSMIFEIKYVNVVIYRK